jgi:predicted NAD/FAD-binding protein
MKIGIVGGGASGLITAYLLNKAQHEVTVFERQPILGGHIRTLNQNVQVDGLNPDYFLESGVLEFPCVFYNFLELMKELEVELESIAVGSALFLKDGKYFLSPEDIEKNFVGLQRTVEFIKLDALYLQSVGLQLKMYLSKLEDLQGQPMSKYLNPAYLGDCWMELLTMYSYSMPFTLMDNFPAELAIPMLQDYVFTNWYRIKGGVYSYIEKILARFTGNILTNVEIAEITRTVNEVQLHLVDGTIYLFDKIVFATPPDQVLKLLVSPTEAEQRCFSLWQKNEARTLIHTDTLMYEKYGVHNFSEFDFLQTEQGWGYNAYLNQLCGISSATPYCLAFNLETLIDPKHIIHTQTHHTPLYTVEAFSHRQEIIERNGENNTYHVGAYLGDGLHEGAVTSAKRVASLLASVD